jgi:CarD family transcriptional regulator
MARELAAVENIDKGTAMEKLAKSLAKKKVAA